MPLDTEASRDLLQSRIAFFALVSAVIVTGFQVLGRVANLVADDVIDRTLGPQALSFHFVTLSLYVLTWLRVRRGVRSLRELQFLDPFVTIVPPLNVSVAAAQIPAQLRPELIILLACAHELMLRAVIVPSSPRRTLAIGCGLGFPLVLGTYRYYATLADPRLPPPYVYTLAAGAWASASIFVSTVVSYTIFG